MRFSSRTPCAASDQVRAFLFADGGEFVAKGFEKPVREYEVKWRED